MPDRIPAWTLQLLLLAVVAAAVASAQTDKVCPSGCPPGFEGRLVLTGPPRNRVTVLRCSKCSSNQFVNVTTNCCQRCRGTITVIGGVPTCGVRLSCPENAETRADPATGASACYCKPGWQATSASTATGVAGCSACPAGTASRNYTQLTTACAQCPDGSAAPKTGLKDCFKCFNGSISTSDHTSCLCPGGSFFVRPSSNTTIGRRLLMQHGLSTRRLLKDGDDKNKNTTKPGDDKGSGKNTTKPGDDKKKNETGPGDDKGGLGGDNSTRPGDDNNSTRPGDDKGGLGGGRGVDDPFKNDDRLFQLGSCAPCPTAGDNPMPSLWSGCCTPPLVWDGTACV